jgi:hypothetical protein
MFDWKLGKSIAALNPRAAVQPSTVIKEGMTLEEVRVAMLRLMAQESINHHHMGQLFNYVVDSKLAEKAGYSNAPEYFAEHLADVSRSALMMYGAVAAGFSEEVASRFGVTCLYLVLTYTEAADMMLDHDAPGGTVIEVPGENGAVEPKLFSACSVDELRKAIQRKRKPSSSKPLPAADVALADAYREAVTARFTKGDGVRVQVRNNKGKAVVDFKNIPLSQVAKLSEALAGSAPAGRLVQPSEKALPTA